MKITYHIPTEQYGFIEVELDNDHLPEGVAPKSYLEVKEWFKEDEVGPGLLEKDFRVALDRYLLSGDMDSEAYAQMNEKQKDIIQCLKRANKRIRAKQSDEEPPF